MQTIRRTGFNREEPRYILEPTGAIDTDHFSQPFTVF
jgi:hypothetical protein